MAEFTEQFRDAPIFDADQHMYETADSLTKHLPEKYSRCLLYTSPSPRDS